MSYYQALGLIREPFSNSPDPDLLYRSKTHLECLQHMEIAVRLRRGLNVVLGEVGTGKTTLARELIRLLGQDGDVEVHFLDDPYFPTPGEFLVALARIFDLDPAACGNDFSLLKSLLKKTLLARGNGGTRIVGLVVDEGQKMTPECLELLRELLNFETNAHKLLQIVIFAQTEFEAVLAARPNLDDRVNFRYRLLPLDRVQTRRMIETRLLRCAAGERLLPIFTRLALRRIHRLTHGYPRKIVRLCHLSMLLAVGYGKKRIGWALVGQAARQQRGPGALWLRRATVAGAVGGVLLLGLGLTGPHMPDARHAALRVLSRAQAFLEKQPAQPAIGVQPPAPFVPGDAASLSDAAAAPASAAAAQGGAAVRGEVSRGVAATIPPLGVSPGLTAATIAPDASESVIVITAEGAKTEAEAGLPQKLGASTVRPGWAITRQAARLYGNGRPHVLSQIAKANPGVNFDRVRAGETIVFPALTAAPLPAGNYLVKLGQADSLEQGFAFLGRYRDDVSGLGLFCTYHPRFGLRFDVVLSHQFATRAQAEEAMAGLPRELATQAALVASYPEGTVYFTELASRGGKHVGGKPGSQPVSQQIAVSQP